MPVGIQQACTRGEQVQVGLVLGEHDGSGGQVGDLVGDGGADLVVVGGALGDQAGPAPAGLLFDASA
jgi:hypothetical protein